MCTGRNPVLPVTSKHVHKTQLINLNQYRASRETNGSSQNREIPPNFINLKFRYCIQNDTPLFHVRSQRNPIHANPSYSFKIQCNTSLPYPPRPPKQSPAFRFPHQNSVSTSSTQMWHTHSPLNFPWCYYPSNILWCAQNMTLLTMLFSPFSC